MKQEIKVSIILDWVTKFFYWVAGLLLVSMMLVISLGVISRYFFHYSIKWMVEVPEYMLYGIIFLAFAWLLKSNSHIRTDVLTTQLNPRNLFTANMIQSFVVLITCLVLTLFGLLEVWESHQSKAVFDYTVRLPKAPVLAIMPLCFFVAFLQQLRQILEERVTWRKMMHKEQ